MKQMDWGDIRYVLAVAQEGSLSGAARVLGVNHATVLRRINTFEERAGVALFDRTARGYPVAPRRKRIVAAMRDVEEAVLRVERAITAARAPLAGTVRVTSTDSLCTALLPPIIAELEAEAEGLIIDLSSQNLHADLSRLDADIAVRPTRALASDLVGEVAGVMGFGLYGAPDGADRWLGFSGSLSTTWLADLLPDDIDARSVGASSDSFVVLREMAAAGQGRTILPCILGDPDPRLIRLPDLGTLGETPLWVASHQDLADVPRIKAVRDLLTRALSRQANALAGITD